MDLISPENESIQGLYDSFTRQRVAAESDFSSDEEQAMEVEVEIREDSDVPGAGSESFIIKLACPNTPATPLSGSPRPVQLHRAGLLTTTPISPFKPKDISSPADDGLPVIEVPKTRKRLGMNGL